MKQSERDSLGVKQHESKYFKHHHNDVIMRSCANAVKDETESTTSYDDANAYKIAVDMISCRKKFTVFFCVNSKEILGNEGEA